ncbi:hypothetical protein BGW36DRAFT_355006 [Talaromyces proteolyticus]|uniref:Uncharacterized protein n=1 Tax=Talaromyces proteolyticus TaxID=1131652 RepID=A0AAD4L0V6_9EURO|nr:uncharacterized protein BGW36DRAFT_355006 [Talaromyces proteolyticus]KAH8703591.1 hypothetical protein BGW36DRAFT_355006 [Talaromyces proteolyticus]
MAPINLITRQSSSSSSSCSGLSGGAIAGVVLGTIAGTLLIVWLIKTCFLPGAPGNRHPDTSDIVYSQTPARRRRRRSVRSGPDYVDYIEKPTRSHSRRGSGVSEVIRVQRPERVYVSS